MTAALNHIAVVVPTRDRPQSLARALRSVLAQSHRELEVVVVDDGSVPAVRLPAELAADPRVQLVRADGLGAAAARNTGVAATGAGLIAFLDDDDAWRPDKLARELDTLRRAPAGTAAVESGFDLRDEGRLVLRYVPDPERELYPTLLERPAMQPSTVLVRRSVFDELGGFDPRLERAEDWDLWVRLAERHDVAALAEVHTDRELNTALRPEDELRYYRSAIERFAPRVAEQPPARRRRITSEHELMLGALAARAGRRAEARRHLLASWRADPRRARPLAHLVRATAGERTWGVTREIALAARSTWLRATGRDPTVRSW